MSWLTTDIGLYDAASVWLANETLQIGLYTDAGAPTDFVGVTDLNEPSFSGSYARITLTGGTVTGTPGDAAITWDMAEWLLTADQSPEQINGYVILDAEGHIFAVESISAFVLEFSGDFLKLTPSMDVTPGP